MHIVERRHRLKEIILHYFTVSRLIKYAIRTIEYLLEYLFSFSLKKKYYRYEKSLASLATKKRVLDCYVIYCIVFNIIASTEKNGLTYWLETMDLVLPTSAKNKLDRACRKKC